MSEQFSELDSVSESNELIVLFTSLSLRMRSGSETGEIGVMGMVCSSVTLATWKFPLLTSSMAFRSYN